MPLGYNHPAAKNITLQLSRQHCGRLPYDRSLASNERKLKRERDRKPQQLRAARAGLARVEVARGKCQCRMRLGRRC